MWRSGGIWLSNMLAVMLYLLEHQRIMKGLKGSGAMFIVCVLFTDTFRALEADGHLDCLNEVDLYCLHFVFLPRINSALLMTLLIPGTIIPYL